MCDSDSKLLERGPAYLADFQATDEWTLEPGDMLYLPPRLAHSGRSRRRLPDLLGGLPCTERR